MDELPENYEPVSPPVNPPQFTLRALFYLTALCAVLATIAGLFGLGGFLAALFLAGVAALFFAVWIGWIRLISAISFLGLLAVLTVLALPPISLPPGPAKRTVCGANLSMLAMALLMYERDHGSLPPAYIADTDGKPMHSWRVLLLPYLENKALFKQYNFDEPWNGPNNSKLADKMPWIYSCPAESQSPKAMTNYLAVVGPHTAWPGSTGANTKQFTDGLGNTILLVELANSDINWMEPLDLDMSQLSLRINSPSGPAISSEHSNGAMVVCADRSTWFLRNDLPPEVLSALLTRDGGEKIDPKVWPGP